MALAYAKHRTPTLSMAEAHRQRTDAHYDARGGTVLERMARSEGRTTRNGGTEAGPQGAEQLFSFALFVCSRHMSSICIKRRVSL